MAMLEAVMGQMYLTLVARLVGLQLRTTADCDRATMIEPNISSAHRLEFNLRGSNLPSAFVYFFKLPGDEIVPSTENEPNPLLGPVKVADPVSEPLPIAPANRPLPPATV